MFNKYHVSSLMKSENINLNTIIKFMKNSHFKKREVNNKF